MSFEDLAELPAPKKNQDKEQSSATKLPSEQTTKLPKKHKSSLGNESPRYVEDVRVVVKEVGRENSPLRLTANENTMLEDSIYDIKRTFGLRTDKTEVERIALNYILNDYQENGEQSILVAIVRKLRS